MRISSVVGGVAAPDDFAALGNLETTFFAAPGDLKSLTPGDLKNAGWGDLRREWQYDTEKSWHLWVPRTNHAESTLSSAQVLKSPGRKASSAFIHLSLQLELFNNLMLRSNLARPEDRSSEVGC